MTAAPGHKTESDICDALTIMNDWKGINLRLMPAATVMGYQALDNINTYAVAVIICRYLKKRKLKPYEGRHS